MLGFLLKTPHTHSILSLHLTMTPQKRKADATSPAGSTEESPHKRARSESTDDMANKQNGNSYSTDQSPHGHTHHSTPKPAPSSNSRDAPGKENEVDPLGDLPQTWDEVDAADKILVKLKQEKYEGKAPWAAIERDWTRLTGKIPEKNTLPDRYRRLRDIMTRSKPSGLVGEEVRPKVFEKPLEISNGISTPLATKARPSSSVIRGSSDKSSRAFTKRTVTAAKSSNPATDRPSDRSSQASSKNSKAAANPSKSASAAPATEIAPGQDLPQSWEQASAEDQLIVGMKTSRIGWAKIEEAWKELTGQPHTEGLVQDRYRRIKDLVIRPETKRTYTYRNTDPMLGRTRKRKAEGEPSEESLDEASEEPSDKSSDESSDEFSKHSMTVARRKPRGAAEQQMKASALDGPSDEANSKRTKLTAEESNDKRVETEPSDESDGELKQPMTAAKNTKRSRAKTTVATTPAAQNTAGTPDEMIVEMKERGCNWVEISKAWTERTGLVYLPDSLRHRYRRIKQGHYSSTKKASATSSKSTAQASSKRNAKATSPDDGSYDSSAKRSKSTAENARVTETSIKRNMDRGKRKSSVKYTDSTTDEDDFLAAPVEPVTTTPNKRNAGRAAKVNRSDPEWLVTNEKSPLAYEDLHAEFSDPKTYENFTKSDWEDLRETLPSNVPINPDGYSIPMTFFKYDPDFRRGIREFQEDLASGRLDPKWQADAAQAMEERARGEFDAYKENQFEAFWGQKQKLKSNVLAGESMKIKLDLLIQNEIFKVGDYFSYSRVFGRGKSGVLVEKDCQVSKVLPFSEVIANTVKIVKVDGKELTFAIPPGQRKYSRRMFESKNPGDTEPGAKAAITDGDKQPPTGVDSKSDATQVVADTEANGGEVVEGSQEGEGALVIKETAENNNLRDDSKAQEAELTLEDKTDEIDAVETTIPEDTEAKADRPKENGIHESTMSEEIYPNGASARTNGGHSSTLPTLQEEEDVLHSISILTQLENKIVDVDGRFNSKDIATQNTWKSFRGVRKMQDLGTLFEMREEFFVYKHPQIVKEAKKKR